MLERSNIEALQTPGALASNMMMRLPLVIRKTIELVHAIQERYLWVDCLCIVQHDSETQFQAYSMNEIYSGAYLTVIAAASDGLGTSDGATGRFRNISSPDDYYHNLMQTKWWTRGWTFQEQILSRRSIIFLDPETDSQPHVFWDCKRAVWDSDKLQPEAISTDVQESPSEALKPNQAPSPTHIASDTGAWRNFRSYLEYVCLYSNRQFTYPQDVLVAFSGILNELSNTLPGGFVQGLPQRFIYEALIWQPFSKAKKRENIVQDGIAPYRYLPSWTWCSWSCAVDPYSFRTGLASSPDSDSRLRVRSWRTKSSVRWSLMSEDRSQEVTLPEPESHSNTGHSLPRNFAFFPYLSCFTAQACFTVRQFLRCNNMMVTWAAVKTSVFDLPQFKNVPRKEDACSDMTVQDSTGEWAGAFRVMDNEEVVPGSEIEIIALSQGEANYADVFEAFEESVACTRRFRYHNNTRLMWGARTCSWQRSVPQDFFDAFNRYQNKQPSDSQPIEEGIYRFYNVMWIERHGDLAYRKAVGRIRSESWERWCGEHVKIVLG